MSRRLRIATISQIAPRKLGSMEDWTVSIAEEALHRGHRMDVFTFSPVHPVVASRLDTVGSHWHDLQSLLSRPLAAARRLAREYDVLAINLFAPRSLMARIAYGAFPAQVVYIDNFSGEAGESQPPSALRRALDRITPFRMAGLVAVSEYVLRRDMARFGVSPPFARCIYNGIDVDRFTPPPGSRPGPPTALAVASLIPEKGIHLLIEAFSRIDLPDARLKIAGEGPERGRLEELVRSRGIGTRVHFLGLRDDVQALLHSAHIFVHPCLWEEAFGLTLAEAQASGCPVVASRIGATPEIITQGETGLLVPPGDIGALARSVEWLLRDSAFRERLSSEARQKATERFALGPSVTAHLDYYEEVARR